MHAPFLDGWHNFLYLRGLHDSGIPGRQSIYLIPAPLWMSGEGLHRHGSAFDSFFTVRGTKAMPQP
jgi:hypothetical protein